MKKITNFSQSACSIAILIVLGLSIPLISKAQKPAKPNSETGLAVTVTPEMLGAGQVSSGAVLPKIPPVTGNRSKPVASWGKPLPYPIRALQTN